MKREIKFRVWHDIDKKFIHSSEVRNSVFPAIPLDKYFSLDQELVTLQQFTGLKDKNGKEIYEGDILVYRKVKDAVHFKDTKTGKNITKKRKTPKEELHYWEVFFSEKGRWLKKRGETTSSVSDNNEGHEIVGNIYENQELINKNE